MSLSCLKNLESRTETATLHKDRYLGSQKVHLCRTTTATLLFTKIATFSTNTATFSTNTATFNYVSH
jgi:hypothetical protein